MGNPEGVQKTRTGYFRPMNFKIGCIDSVVVDPHNEVYAYWAKTGINKAALFHVDAHPDMYGFPLEFDGVRSKKRFLTVGDYSKKILHIGDFIIAAMHY